MEQTLLLLTIALAAAFIAAVVASLVPGQVIPEVVILLFAGAFLGRVLPYSDNTGMQVLSELGMAFLFLMAGFEIEPSREQSKMTLHATLSWAVSFAIALVVTVVLLSRKFTGIGAYAFAVALTTTAYGTLAPIMRERHLSGTRVGKAVTSYGALGEILPILAMAFLLSVRSRIETTVILVVYVGVCVSIAMFPRRANKVSVAVRSFLRSSAEANSESPVRVVVLLLVFLVFLARAMGFDAALGAFAAGFTLRALLPAGNVDLERKLRALSRGFFIPIFFFYSGTNIDLSSAFSDMKLLVGYIVLLVFVRGVVVAISLYVAPETHDMSWREIFSAATYCTMALPLVIAVTGIAVDNGAMTSSDASVLVTAGAITVLIVPLITSFVRVASEAYSAEAIRLTGDASFLQALHQGEEALREGEQHFHSVRAKHAREMPTPLQARRKFSSADYFAMEQQEEPSESSKKG